MYRARRAKLREAYQYLEDAQLSQHAEAGPLLIKKALEIITNAAQGELGDFEALPVGLKFGDKGVIIAAAVNTLDVAINLLELVLSGKIEAQSISEAVGDAMSHVEEAMDS